MSNTDVIGVIIQMVADMMSFMLPIMAVMGGITFVVSFLVYVVFGWGRHTFRN